MKKTALSLFCLLIASFAAAQTTYTTTSDACNGKANMYCTLPVADQNGTPSMVTIDNRNNFGNLYPNGWGSASVHGTYSGFISNPDGTRNDFYWTGYFASDATIVDSDGVTVPKVAGTFNYKAHYVGSCSGRGCGGTLGWHYSILTGSTVEVQ